ncbi:hypothetical protein [Methanorbis rubei]|uniref:hypothetical protein n=1 Tax=Methanorbis rubei TaxID=3028300 RepID=UPI0030B90A82
MLIVALIPPDSGGLVAIATAPANAGRRQSGAAIVESINTERIEIIQPPQAAPDWRRPACAVVSPIRFTTCGGEPPQNQTGSASVACRSRVMLG